MTSFARQVQRRRRLAKHAEYKTYYRQVQAEAQAAGADIAAPLLPKHKKGRLGLLKDIVNS